jgi:methylase of polypeptide subunit release factors
VTLISKTRSHAERGLDAYFTCVEATRALMGLESLPHRIFDPCVGNGAILNILEEAGHQVSGADIHNYGWPTTIIKDFLAHKSDLRGTAIVSNPPYRRAREFIQKAIDEGSPYHA